MFQILGPKSVYSLCQKFFWWFVFQVSSFWRWNTSPPHWEFCLVLILTLVPLHTFIPIPQLGTCWGMSEIFLLNQNLEILQTVEIEEILIPPPLCFSGKTFVQIPKKKFFFFLTTEEFFYLQIKFILMELFCVSCFIFSYSSYSFHRKFTLNWKMQCKTDIYLESFWFLL